MAVQYPTFPGQDNANATSINDTRDLLLIKFSNEVLTQFDEEVVMKDLHMIRTAPSGSKAAQFPVVGRALGQYHTPGNNLLTDANRDGNDELSRIRHAQRLISIDELLQASVFVDSLEELLNHYDLRSIYSMELGRALARAFDNHAIRTVIGAARSTATLTAGPSLPSRGGILQDADFQTNGASAAATCFRLAKNMDLRDLPKMGRALVVEPGTYYNLTQQSDLITRDWNPANGSMAEGEIMRCAGIRIVSSVNLPSANETAAAGSVEDSPGSTNNGSAGHVQNNLGSNEGYGLDYSSSLGIAFHESAIGTVKAMDLTVESDYLIQYQGNLMVAKYAMGHGVLRPEAAIEVSTAMDTAVS